MAKVIDVGNDGIQNVEVTKDEINKLTIGYFENNELKALFMNESDADEFLKIKENLKKS